MNVQECIQHCDAAHQNLREAMEKITPGMNPVKTGVSNTQIVNAFGLLRASIVTLEAARRELSK